MKPRLILLLLAAHAGAALAQYKCTAADGAITFQQTPCFGAKSEEKLTIVPNGHPPAASGAGPAAAPAPRKPVSAAAAASHPSPQTADQRLLASYQRQQGRDPLVQELNAAREQQAQRASQLQQDVAAARARYGDNPVDAAALNDAIAAINNRYAAMRVIDDERVRNAEHTLALWDNARH